MGSKPKPIRDKKAQQGLLETGHRKYGGKQLYNNAQYQTAALPLFLPPPFSVFCNFKETGFIQHYCDRKKENQFLCTKLPLFKWIYFTPVAREMYLLLAVKQSSLLLLKGSKAFHNVLPAGRLLGGSIFYLVLSVM